MAATEALPPDDPRVVLGTRKMTFAQYRVIFICVLVNMIDGYDILAISLAGASLKAAWGLSDAALGTLLAMHLIGMAAGALAVSPIADQWGRRPAVLGCLVLMSAGMAFCSVADGYGQMVAGRLVTGLGIGGMTATVGMLALEYAHYSRREFAASVVASAYPVGTIIGGLVAATALNSIDWRAIFWVGALLSAVLLPLAFLYMSESLDFLLNRQPKNALKAANKVLRRMAIPEIIALPPKPEGSKDAVLQEIRQPIHVKELGKLFLAHALNMFGWYFIIQWAPPLIAETSGDPVLGAKYSQYFSYGGIIGGMTAGYLCGLFGTRQIMWTTMLGMGALIALFGIYVQDPMVLLLLAPFIGAALFGSATANWLTIAFAFPPQLRATGLGFATTAGRVGAVGGPWVGGRLLDSRASGEVDFGLFSFDATMTIASVCAIIAVSAVLSAITFSRARKWEEKV